jgi:recombination protein RecA
MITLLRRDLPLGVGVADDAASGTPSNVLRLSAPPPSPLVSVRHEGSSVEPRVPWWSDVLPDGGLPRGAVVELSGHRGLGRITSLGLAACAAAQAEARLRTGNDRTLGAMCAFVDPWATLHGPALARHGVDASRLVVARPPVEALARVAVRVVESRAFAVVVIDLAGVPGVRGDRVRLERWVKVVRRLALAVEHGDATLLLLTDGAAARVLPLPVALRLEVDRPLMEHAPAGQRGLHLGPGLLSVRVAKDRFGRIRQPVSCVG